jgi:hypothetical protein
LNTGEIFTGTPDELVEKLAHSSATTHVYGKRLKTELEQARQQQPQAPPQQPTAPHIDPAEQMIADITARNMGFDNAAQMKQAYTQMHMSQQEIQGRIVANQFMAENPDFAPSEHNSRVLTEILQQQGIQETPQTLAMAHHYLKSTGQYEQVSVPPRGQQWNRPQVPPQVPNGTPSSNAPGVSEEELWKMPMNDLAALAQKRTF